MKKYLSLAVVLILLYATLLTAIPASALSVGPYNTSDACIKSITVNKTTKLADSKATYYKATVNSSEHGINKTYKNRTMHVTIGTAGYTRFFVYSAESSDGMSYSKKSVHDLVVDFEKENPDWKVVAAVNGDFFNTNTGEPEEPMVQNGQTLKGNLPSDWERRGGGIVGTSDTTGKAVYHTIGAAYKQAGYGTTYYFRGDYQVQILDSTKQKVTKTYDAFVGKAPTALTVSFAVPDQAGDFGGLTVYEVELERYRKDTGSKNNKRIDNEEPYYYFAQGKVTKKVTGTASMKPSKGKAYIAVKTANQLPELKVGAIVRCQKVLMGEWDNVSNAIGFKQQILAEGNVMFKNAYSRYHTGDGASQSETERWTEDIYDYPFCWKARTAIGFMADGTPVFLTSEYDGKNHSITYYELSCQFKALGCTNAFLLDGGGSSTMVIRNGDSLDTVHSAEENSNNGEGRSIANIAIMAVRKDGKIALDPEETEKATSKATTKKPNNKKTEKATEALTDLATDFTESETGVAQSDGCGGALVFPAILATGGIAVVGFSKKRGDRKSKKK